MGVCSQVDKENNLGIGKKNSLNYSTYNCLVLKTSGKSISNFSPEINKKIVVLANVQ